MFSLTSAFEFCFRSDVENWVKVINKFINLRLENKPSSETSFSPEQRLRGESERFIRLTWLIFSSGLKVSLAMRNEDEEAEKEKLFFRPRLDVFSTSSRCLMLNITGIPLSSLSHIWIDTRFISATLPAAVSVTESRMLMVKIRESFNN